MLRNEPYLYAYIYTTNVGYMKSKVEQLTLAAQKRKLQKPAFSEGETYSEGTMDDASLERSCRTTGSCYILDL